MYGQPKLHAVCSLYSNPKILVYNLETIKTKTVKKKTKGWGGATERRKYLGQSNLKGEVRKTGNISERKYSNTERGGRGKIIENAWKSYENPIIYFPITLLLSINLKYL